MQSLKHVFISFKTEERDLAFQLQTALTASGYKIWWQEEIQCGQEWHGEIDKAIEAAGAIVVLWSNKSLSSIWVRHEASQAIVKGVYTPVRVEAMEIDSPYNRVQATDIVNWTGDINHPGFQNLLVRLNELMPPPISLWEQSKRFIWKQRAVIILSVVAITALYLLLKQSTVLNKQIEKQEEIFKALTSQIQRQEDIYSNVQRTLQPIQNLSVFAFVDLDASIPGVKEYLSYLKETLLDKSSGKLKKQLPGGVYISTGRDDDPQQLSIPEASGLWPSKQDSSWLYYVIKYVEISLVFRKSKDSASAISDKNPPDLAMSVGSYDPDGSESGHPFNTELQWDIKSNSLSIFLRDVPSTEYWQSNGEIVSVPDIEKATIAAKFLSTMVPSLSDKKTGAAVLRSRRGLSISSLFIEYSGRKLHFRGYDMKKGVDDSGLLVYRAPVLTGIDSTIQ